MIPPADDLDGLFKRLSLANARRVWRDLVQRAERERWSYQDFLTVLAVEEIGHRQQTRLARLTRWAHFPFLKTIDDFNFTYQSTLRLTMLGSALAPDFVTEGRSLILTGKPGRGKTHLAIAIAYRAIQNGFDARFTTAATLIDDLSAAFRAGQLAAALPAYTHPAVLVVD
jgi:DNA replication protein DnaC